MKKLINILILILLFSTGFVLNASAQGDQSKISEIANQVFDNFVNEKYENNLPLFNQEMKDALPADKMKTVWEQINTQAGRYQSKGETSVDIIKGYRVAYVECSFEKTHLQLKVVFDESDKVAGLFFIPMGAK